LGVGGRKRKSVGVRAREKRVGSRGEEKEKVLMWGWAYFLFSFNHVGYA